MKGHTFQVGLGWRAGASFPRPIAIPLALVAAASISLSYAAGAAAQSLRPAPSANPPSEQSQTGEPATATITLPTVDVRSRADLLGSAETASQGSVTQEEIRLRPQFRVGQILETVPGLVVTVHSGEGKANQYLLRGFNLDHGTDFATYVDDMPVNQPTHAHGQGYTDIHFLMPELVAGLDYTKGPFYAPVGDFGALGSAHLRLSDELPTQMSVSAGTLGDQRVFLGGTWHMDNGDRLISALAFSHYDGPWTHPDDFKSYNGTLRYVHGDRNDGFDLTAMAYRGTGNLTTDQPVSAYQSGLIGRYGSLDPSDGDFAERYSLSGHYYVSGNDWKITTGAYVIHERLTLWNDFTHFLADPVNGDQEQQDETRTTAGGQVVYQRFDSPAGIATDTSFGLMGRYDTEFIDRRHTQSRLTLADCPGFGSDAYTLLTNGRYVCDANRVQLGDVGLWISNTTRWLPWMRTIVGLREEVASGTDRSLIPGVQGVAGNSVTQELLQPKASIVFGPWASTELYASIGRGFHSNDLRGVLGTLPTQIGENLVSATTPLLTKIDSEEFGIRTNILPLTSITAALFREQFASFLTYDADIGQNQPGPPARLDGIELSAQVKPFDWLELNGDINFTKSRFRTGNPAAYGLTEPYNGGNYIPNAPNFIGSFGALVDHLGPWFGGVEMRWLGPYPLVPDNSYRSPGYKEVNLDIGYKITEKISVKLGIYNLFNSHANASQYFYQYQVSPTASAQNGTTFHPLEPLSARLTLTALF